MDPLYHTLIHIRLYTKLLILYSYSVQLIG